jgi:uncharacterized protein YegP (UPF0339 family)
MFEIYKSDTDGKMRWHWRLLLGSGKRAIAISASSEGFGKRSQAIADIDRIREIAGGAEMMERL